MSRILIIEDERAIADTIVYAITSEGMQPTWVGTGREGLRALGREAFSLVVLDVGLPDMSGFDVCRELRKLYPLPVIFLTARAEEIDRIVGLEIGGDDYVTKPFSPRELVARIKAILRRGAMPAQASAPAKAFPFLVDKNKMSISYFGVVLELTRYEFRLLQCLVERPGWVFSRDELMTAGWEDPTASDDRTVDAHVKTLRSKLRAIRPEIDPIKTHRGIGYALREDW